MLKNKKTYYQLILDRSGSMGSCAEEAVSGFNEQVQQIKLLQEKYPEQEFLVSLTTFNHSISMDIDRQRAAEIKELYVSFIESHVSNKDAIAYVPDGMTALYDAIGQSVNHLENVIGEEVARDEATAVVVIITDGWENSSREYSYKEVQRLIGRLEKTNDWTFSYLGATPDAVNIAVNLNIMPYNAMCFNKKTFKKTYQNLNANLDDYARDKQAYRKPKDFLRKNKS